MASGVSNLILVSWEQNPHTWADLSSIAARVPRFDSSVRAHVVARGKLKQLGLAPLWWKRCLSVSIRYQRQRGLLPGKFLCGRNMSKIREYERLDAAGIPVPKWTIISADTALDPAEWGPYVVEKPAAGLRGAMVRIRKTGRVRHVPPGDYPEDHPGRKAPMLAQRFIYTGRWPTSYRVITLFGEVLLCYRQTSLNHGPPLESRYDFRALGGINIVSNTRDMKMEPSYEAEVIALAERAHRTAFRDLPVLAFDIVQDAETGELYVLETHARGNWLFTSERGLAIQATANTDLRSQFNALEKAAQVLARETVRRAEICPPYRNRRLEALPAVTSMGPG